MIVRVGRAPQPSPSTDLRLLPVSSSCPSLSSVPHRSPLWYRSERRLMAELVRCMKRSSRLAALGRAYSEVQRRTRPSEYCRVEGRVQSEGGVKTPRNKPPPATDGGPSLTL